MSHNQRHSLSKFYGYYVNKPFKGCQTEIFMKKRLISIILICIAALFPAACGEEEEVILKSTTISVDSLQFEIPMGFIVMEEKSDETTTYYESELHEVSKVIYESLENDGSFESIDGEATLPDIKAQLRETYLANSNPELVEEERTQLDGRPAYKYIVSYNLYDAPMLHSHCYIEDGDVIHHIEYIGVEEEGYDASFALYFDNIRFE